MKMADLGSSIVKHIHTLSTVLRYPLFLFECIVKVALNPVEIHSAPQHPWC